MFPLKSALRGTVMGLSLAAAMAVFQAGAAPALSELSKYSGVSVNELQQAMAQAQKQQAIIDTMTRPYESKPWYQYRKLFITTSRIQSGVAFYLAHEQTLKRAEQELGIPPEIICAIIGVETFYGKNMGSWKVLDALYTLGFHYPPRETYFSKEFANYVKLAKREGWVLTSTKGSYAGAMGMGQFMPGSYLDYAIDFDGDGRVNLFTSYEDVIGSVANYFKRHGWKSGRGILYEAHVSSNPKAMIDKQWDNTAANLYQHGVSTKVYLNPNQKARLFSFPLEDGSQSYAVGLNNFYVIMTYNKSQLYARAVFELSEFIRMGYVKAKLGQGEVIQPQGNLP